MRVKVFGLAFLWGLGYRLRLQECMKEGAEVEVLESHAGSKERAASTDDNHAYYKTLGRHYLETSSGYISLDIL